jgi:NAD(P)H-dependent flavin oxidoreductase YrpB (nitropropane dioxygenase family)
MGLLTSIESGLYALPGLRIGDKEAAVAIVQGGMGVGISLSNLAAAVAREGGIGVIAANAIGMTEADYYDDPAAANVRALRREVREARRRSNGLIGVNIMVAVDCFHQLLDAAIEEKADILFLGAGLHRLAEKNEARYREERARIRERLTQIRAEYLQVKARLRELRAELDSVTMLAPALEAA